jgi:hypothetical protein
MKTNTKLTSVTVLDETYKKFKLNTIDGSINFQKLVNRAMDLYNKNEDFREKINTHTGLSHTGSKF